MGITVDAHSDLLIDVHQRRMAGEKNTLESRWVPLMKEGKIDLRVATIYLDSRYLPEQALRAALDMAATLLDEIDQSPESYLCTGREDIRGAGRNGKIGFIMGMEGAEPLGTDLQLLNIFQRLGLRVLGLTHARPNAAAEGALFIDTKRSRPGGLTEFGVELVELAEKLGILVDVSHLNETSFWDVCKFAQRPFIASHSNTRVLWDHPRNLTDDQIRAVADAGGVTGINACAMLVSKNGQFSDLMDHLDHLYKIGGREHVGLGPDFCDYLNIYLSPLDKRRVPPDAGQPVAGLPGDAAIPGIAEELSRRGYSSADIDLIMGENFRRVFEAGFPA